MNTQLEQIFYLLARSTSQNYIGEAISQLEHALQAADLSRRYTDNPCVTIACLFHDIGHLIDDPVESMGTWGVTHHELIGAALVRRAQLPSPISELISSHVEAKRYLVTMNEHYRKNLSPASQKTLEYQGGFLSLQELDEFEADPLFQEKLLVRRCDDEAKVVGQITEGLEFYKNYVVQFLKSLPRSHPTEGEL